MINEQIMVDTVRRLLEAGIDDPTIVSTLTEAGLTNEEALSVIQKVKTPTPAPAPTPAPQATQFAQQQVDVAIMRNELSAQAQVSDLQQTQMHNKLDLHEQKIDEVSQKIDEVKQAVTTVTSPTDGSLSYRISALEQKLEEITATTKATLDVMQKVLETDRKILTELEAKK